MDLNDTSLLKIAIEWLDKLTDSDFEDTSNRKCRRIVVYIEPGAVLYWFAFITHRLYKKH